VNRPIFMVDLVGQHRRIQLELENEIIRVSREAAYIQGPDVNLFSTELSNYLGDNIYTITCANGTDALQIALMSLGLKPGDEVITAAFTYIATAEVISLLQLTPILVDVDYDTFSLDIEQVKNAISPRTKAIIPVHLFGQSAKLEQLKDVVNDFSGIYIIEDVAQALGAQYTFSNGEQRALGTIGDIGCTSFFPSKNLGCMGDGGAIFTRDKDLANKLKMIANHGQSVKYRHDVIGCNSRLDTIQAAILSVKLKYLNAYSDARRKAAEYYDLGLSNISNIKTPVRNLQSTHVFNQYTLRVLDGRRDSLADFLKSSGIPTMIYYPLPIHQQNAFKSSRYPDGSFPISEKLCKQVLSIPMHTELDIEQQDYIISKIKSYYE
jgi:UDP-2-acetamido-2-deoxy-ribo-hexuluronate aminotransferase